MVKNGACTGPLGSCDGGMKCGGCGIRDMWFHGESDPPDFPERPPAPEPCCSDFEFAPSPSDAASVLPPLPDDSGPDCAGWLLALAPFPFESESDCEAFTLPPLPVDSCCDCAGWFLVTLPVAGPGRRPS